MRLSARRLIVCAVAVAALGLFAPAVPSRAVSSYEFKACPLAVYDCNHVPLKVVSEWSAVESPLSYFLGCGAYYDKVTVNSPNETVSLPYGYPDTFRNGSILMGWDCG